MSAASSACCGLADDPLDSGVIDSDGRSLMTKTKRNYLWKGFCSNRVVCLHAELAREGLSRVEFSKGRSRCGDCGASDSAEVQEVESNVGI